MREGLATALIAALMLLAVWRRFRFLRMRHPVRPRRMLVRVAVFMLIGAGLLSLPWVSLPLALGAAGLGGALAAHAVRVTAFEPGEGSWTFRPTSRVGLVIFALFVGRMTWRLIERIDGGPPAGGGPFAPRDPLPDHMPLTLLLGFVMIGYTICYTAGILLRARAVRLASGAGP